MIPDHLIDKAAAAIYASTAFGDEFAYDAWRDMDDDSPIKTTTRMYARAALETVAADIWERGHVCGYSDAQDTARGIRLGAHNPYKRNENA